MALPDDRDQASHDRAAGRPPRPRVRDSLVQIAERIDSAALTLVVAPAGSGKTTLLDAWRERLAERELPAASLALGPLHGDGFALLADLLAAIRAVRPGFGSECERALAEPDPDEDAWHRLARAFERDRAADPHALVVALDDFHELPPASAGARLVDSWLRRPLPNLFWVIATRGAAPPAAARLRQADAVVDVGGDDLSLRADEIDRVLAGRGVEARAGLTARLLARTAGWATGVQLAARRLAALPEAERDAYLDRLGREPDLFAFVSGEVLRGEDEAVRTAAEIVALVGPCAPAEVAGIGLDPRAPEAIGRAVEQGVLASDGETVRTHPLWGEVLRERARTHRPEEERRALLARAGPILRSRGRHEAALEAFAAAGDWPGAAATLGEAGPSFLREGRGELLRRWLERLPAELVEAEPELLVTSALSILRRDRPRGFAMLERAARTHRQRGDRTSERRVVALLGLLHLGALQREEALRALRRLVSLRGLLSDPAERGFLLVLVAGRRLLGGRFAASLSLAERAAALPLDPVALFLNSAHLGLLRGVRGEWGAALTALGRGLAGSEPGAQPFSRRSLELLVAQVQARSGAYQQARDTLARLEEDLGRHRRDWLRAMLAQEASYVALRLGDAEEAQRRQDEVCRYSGGGAVEALMRADAAIHAVRTGQLADAAREAARALELVRAHGDPVLAMAPWWTCFALWAQGRAGDPGGAWRAAHRLRRSFHQPVLRLAHHAMQLALADLALRAGDEREARRIARDAFAFAAREGLQAPDPWVGDLTGPSLAELAVRDDGSPAALDRLVRTSPERASALLGELAADPDAAVRERAVVLLARRGGRASFEPLRRASRDAEPRVAAAARAALAGLGVGPGFALRVVSLGGLAVWRGAEPIAAEAWKGQTARRLFARLLVADGRAVARERLLADLWPDTEPAAARNNLRVATARLHEVLDPERPAGMPPHFVLAGDDDLRLHPDATADWDAARFRAELAAAAEAERRGDAAAALAAVRAACALYGGPLLEDLEAEWVEPLRRELARRFAAAAHRLGPRLVRRGRLDEALALAERLLRADPADEQAFALRMRAQLAGHDRAGALRSYQEAVAALARELELEPGDELRRLAAQARERA